MIDRSRILVIGDSYSAAREADTGRDHGWPAYMRLSPANCQAVTGSTAKQWAEDYEQRMRFALCTDADMVILSLLGNDAFAVMADNVVTAAEVADALQNMRRVMFLLKQEGFRIVVLLYPDPFSGRRCDFELAVPILNAAIRSACMAVHAEFVDLGAVLQPSDFNGTDIHPTVAGHRKIAEHLERILEVGSPA